MDDITTNKEKYFNEMDKVKWYTTYLQ
jgi:hypothetical protein